jgi:ribosomal protein S18 acetylase RimI-like enzyme
LGGLESARGRGIATALMLACHAHARESALAAVVLSTDPLMVDARRLYETLGYLRTPERDWSAAGVDLLTFRLQL